MGDNRSESKDPSLESTSELIFFLNGEKITERDPNPVWTLAYYLRFKLRLCGTKEACGEGGCGACTVLLQKFDSVAKKIINIAINACLTPLCSVHGTSVITVEGIGSVKKGLHPVQERIAKSHGTQCGFCTPGFVMSVYALLRNNSEPTEQELEDAFQGNLCRCTGYRPILQGFKTLCKKSETEGNGCCRDQVRNGAGCCMDAKISGGGDSDTNREVADTLFDESQFKPYDPQEDIIFPPELQINTNLRKQTLHFMKDNVTWLKPASLVELLDFKEQYPAAKCVAGNTELGIETRFNQKSYNMFIHVSDIDELKEVRADSSQIELGGAVIISDLKELCRSKSNRSGTVFGALDEMLYHFAGRQIRNVATIAGSVLSASPFSDIIPVLMACRAKVALRSRKGSCVVIADGERLVCVDESFYPKFRTTSIRPNEILEYVRIPFTADSEFVWTAKQARRRDDDRAIVSTCMRVKLNPISLIVEDAMFAVAGMGPTTKLAKMTSEFLIGKKWSESTIDEVAPILLDEMKLEMNAPGGMAIYKQVLMQSFVKKFYITVTSWIRKTFESAQSLDMIKPNDVSAVAPISRGETRGVQLYQVVPKSQKVEDLIGRPIPHLSALKHATGEAIYTDDELPLRDELYGALVGSPIAFGKILSIDASKALAVPGVVDFIHAKSPGSWDNAQGFTVKDEEVFASEYVRSQGQTIGILVAEDPLTAEKASKLVKMTFEHLEPILTIEEAMEKESLYAVRKLKYGDIAEAFSTAEEVLEGEMKIGGQEHFYMETHSCIVTPKEDDEIDILIACQGPSVVQKCVADVLRIPRNRVKIHCRRMGGGFGGKDFRAITTAVPTAVAAVKLGRPVRTVLTRWDDMVVTGGRHPFSFKYKVAHTKEGRILGVQGTMCSNAGYSSDWSPAVMEKALLTVDAAYTIPNWDITGYVCKTNLPSNTAFRGFGGPQASVLTEVIMDAVAEKLGRSPVEIREMHLKRENGDKAPFGFDVPDCTVRKCWKECVTSSNFYERQKQVEKFNEENHWKKRGIAVMPMKHDVGYHFTFMNQGSALVMIYTDGSVGLNHGGTEMGQGLLTKMAQVASRVLGISIEKIYFSETSTDKIPNATASCGSMTSDVNGLAVMNACEKLVKRLEPYKQQNPDGKWEDWVAAAYLNRVNLCAYGFFEVDVNFDFDKPEDISKGAYNYTVYGVAVSEVEVDCLTGDHSVLRTDIVIDVGESLNPAIDIGQIEGAFMQGYGLFVMEELLYTPTGQMLTKGPGMYKIPSMGDIPREFNVSFLRGTSFSNPRTVYSSKGIGEPPLFLAASVYFAIKEAIKAFRRENGLSTLFRLDCPATAERIRLACEDDAVKIVKENTNFSFKLTDSWAINV